MTGALPAEIGGLSRLDYSDLSYNGVSGPIPAELGKLTRLGWLELNHNHFEGALPSEMGGMKTLEYFDVAHNNKLGGAVPHTFARLELETFYSNKTELCVPPSLKAWFEAIPEASEPLPCIPETPDRDVLVRFYNTTGGPDCDRNRNWLSNRSLNTWYGIVTDEEGYVTEVSLVENNIAGPIPPEFGSLTRLEVLEMYYNHLSGAIPPELGNLSNLVHLGLYENELEGAIPPELGNLPRFGDFHLSENQLTGTIPAALGNLPVVVDFGVQNNNLTGPIPPEFGGLTSLVLLSLYNNNLSGPIPPEIGNLSNLELFDAGENQFDGPLPPEFSKLAKLERLLLDESGLNGPIPPELGNLKKLKDIWLYRNQLEGPIPPELGGLDSLVTMVLHTNQLDGPLPPELGKLSKLEFLWLDANKITGPIPPELGNLKALKRLRLSRNQLSGPIPPELGNLTSLKWLILSKNRLSGSIPPELGQMSSLVQLALYNNQFSGPLPPEIGDLGDLEDLRLQDNPNLEGLLPRSVLNLPLGHLNIRGTDLCAQLDDEFQEWLGTIEEANGWECPATQIERLVLSELYASTGGNSWTSSDGWESDSSVDDWYGVTVGDSLIEQLRLPGNGLRGPLPPEIGNLRELETLDLADNSLTGEVPVTITSLDALDTIGVSGNTDMHGPLPSRMIEMTGLKALQYADTDLCAPPSARFQAWIDGLDLADGTTCDNPDEVRLSLPVVYLTQAIQRPRGDVPLLSGREALLRVFLVSDQEHAFFEPEVVATFTRDGKEVHRVVLPSGQDLLATSADEGSLISSYNAVIPAEHIVAGTELIVVADSAGTVPQAAGSQTRFPQTGSYALEVIDVPPMELTVVPVLEAEDPDLSTLEWTDSVGDDSPQVSLFKYSFPFSEFSAKARDAHVTSLDLTDEDDQWRLVLELEVVRRNEEATGYWYGAALTKNGSVRGVARLNGWVSIGKPWDTELAHEVGHNFDLNHAPCGGALGTDPDFPYPNGSIGMWGYDFRNSSLVSPRHRRDIMGYCFDKGWLSDFYFEKVVRVREEKEGEEAQARMAATGPKGEMLVLWGGVLGDELRIEPVHPMYTTAKLPEEAGPYRIEGIGRGGESEFSLSFTPGEDQYGNKYFFFTIPIEADWADSLERITLTGPEGEVTVDGNDPRSVTIVTDPATGRIRAILRDWNQPLPTALGNTAGLEVETTRGILEAVRLRR